MLTRVQAFVAALVFTTTASAAPALKPPPLAAKPAPAPPRCDVKINQPAASVSLNRSKAPYSVCVAGCDAKLVGVRTEQGRIAALAIYTGRRCRPAPSKAPAKPVAAAAAAPGPQASAR